MARAWKPDRRKRFCTIFQVCQSGRSRRRRFGERKICRAQNQRAIPRRFLEGGAEFRRGVGFCIMTRFGRFVSMLNLDLSDYCIVRDMHFSLGGQAAELARQRVPTRLKRVCPRSSEDKETANERLDISEQPGFLHTLCRTDSRRAFAVLMTPRRRLRPIFFGQAAAVRQTLQSRKSAQRSFSIRHLTASKVLAPAFRPGMISPQTFWIHDAPSDSTARYLAAKAPFQNPNRSRRPANSDVPLTPPAAFALSMRTPSACLPCAPRPRSRASELRCHRSPPESDPPRTLPARTPASFGRPARSAAEESTSECHRRRDS